MLFNQGLFPSLALCGVCVCDCLAVCVSEPRGYSATDQIKLQLIKGMFDLIVRVIVFYQYSR